MISRFLEHLFVLTSISPVFLAVWISESINAGSYIKGLFWLILFIILIPLSWIIINFSEKKLEVTTIKVKSIAPADREVTAFLIAYILPILSFMKLNIWIILFIVGLLYISMLTTSNYHFNPVLGLFFGYHYYEVEIEGENGGKIIYILMTKRTIKNAKNIRKIVQVSDYMLMEVEYDR